VIGVLGGRHGDECLCLIRYVHSLLLRLLRNTPGETLTTVRLAVAHAVGVDREAVIEVCGPAYLAALQQVAQFRRPVQGPAGAAGFGRRLAQSRPAGRLGHLARLF